jgi:hypothetical protein
MQQIRASSLSKGVSFAAISFFTACFSPGVNPRLPAKQR